ncbi:UNVERIFIED_CONTAM: hypothetical protein Sindi_1035200 [Sesamum indicum]
MKKQCTVSRFFAEVEYLSMAATTYELQWISYLLKDFGIAVSHPILFHCDNQAAIHMIQVEIYTTSLVERTGLPSSLRSLLSQTSDWVLRKEADR